MDDRQRQIRERAGLEESRINIEFVEFLKKWGTPILFAVAVAAGSVAAYRWYHERTADRTAQAFIELDAARAGGSPDALTAVADQYEGIESVAALALLDAADSYMRSVITTVKPGSILNEDGSLKSPEDALTPEERASMLDRAGALYQRAYESVRGKPGKSILEMNALFGLASVAESKEDWEGAKARYEQVVALTKGTAYNDQARLAQSRIDTMGSIKVMPVLPRRADLPPLPPPEPPKLPPGLVQPLPGPEAPGPAGPEAPPAPEPVPAPEPAPVQPK